jgi:hypothetical protein
MATKLDKDISRESTVIVDDREIMVTLTKDQKISMKLKGKRTGAVSIGIDELYGQLTGKPITTTDKKAITITQSKTKPTKKNPMILLSDLRSQSAIAAMDYETKAKFDRIIKSLMDKLK